MGWEDALKEQHDRIREHDHWTARARKDSRRHGQIELLAFGIGEAVRKAPDVFPQSLGTVEAQHALATRVVDELLAGG